MPVELPAPPRPEPPRAKKGLWLLLILQLCTLAALAALLAGVVPRGVPSGTGGLPERERAVASKLKAAGALNEAADLYERYLDGSALDAGARVAVAFGLGQLYLEQGQYERALRWFYEAETLGPGERKDEVNQRIVHCLEALGRVHAAQAALDRTTRLDQPDAARPADDAVVARIGQEAIHRSDLQRALDDLPPFLRQRFQGPAGLAEFLQKYVADELILRKARKLEYDQDPEVRRQLEAAVKQLVVSRFIEREVLGKLVIDPADVANHFAAHREKYDEPASARLRLIKVASKQRAAELKRRLAAGADFAALAAEASLDAATKGQGGLLDRWIKRGEDFLGEGDARVVADVVFRTPAGEVSDPTPAGKHFYLFRTEERRAGKAVKLEDVRQRVEQDYRLMKTQAAYAEMIKQTLAAEDVELFPEKLQEETK